MRLFRERANHHHDGEREKPGAHDKDLIRDELSKFINVTKHLANQLLYRNSHKSNQIKSNVGFW